MLFKYKVINDKGQTKTGEIDAVNTDFAIASLQRRGLIVVSMEQVKERQGKKGEIKINFRRKIPLKDIVMMSRQLSTLFEAQVSAVKSIDLMSDNVENEMLGDILKQVSRDIQGGSQISAAMRKHPKAFSKFYVNMIGAGEETGRLSETFVFLADYLKRQYELTSKTRSALVYPAFIVFTFFGVMILMMTIVIPKLGEIINDSGAEVPIYTEVVLGISDFLTSPWAILLLLVLIICWGISFCVFAQSKVSGKIGRVQTQGAVLW